MAKLASSMLWKLAALSIVTLMPAPQTAVAQVVACPPADGTLEGLSKRMDCLEETLSATVASQAVLERTLREIYASAEALGIELRGPKKEMELIPASDHAITKVYQWPDGSLIASFDCVTPAGPREGFTVFGAQIGAEQEVGAHNPGINIPGFGFGGSGSGAIRTPDIFLGEAGCSQPPHCRGNARERCVRQARAPGCYIKTEWFEWLQRQPDAAITFDTVCRP